MQINLLTNSFNGTETTLLKVQSDIPLGSDKQYITFLKLLHLSFT